jgi:hypothetical protein
MKRCFALDTQAIVESRSSAVLCFGHAGDRGIQMLLVPREGEKTTHCATRNGPQHMHIPGFSELHSFFPTKAKKGSGNQMAFPPWTIYHPFSTLRWPIRLHML